MKLDINKLSEQLDADQMAQLLYNWVTRPDKTPTVLGITVGRVVQKAGDLQAANSLVDFCMGVIDSVGSLRLTGARGKLYKLVQRALFGRREKKSEG